MKVEQSLESPQILHLPDYLPSPSFDKNKAIKASKVATELVSQRTSLDLPGLQQTLALRLYQESCDPEQMQDNLQLSLEQTIDTELSYIYLDPSLPVPTTGWEVEAPIAQYASATKPIESLRREYNTFCNKIGLPTNRANATYADKNYWEFAPSYTFAAETAEQGLDALIQAHMIPDPDPNELPLDQDEYLAQLSKKRISFHVNLGTPYSIFELSPELKSDGHYLATAIALAFTSPDRMLRKSSSFISDYKKLLSRGSGERLEIKALELRNQSSLDQLHHAQMLGTTLFAYHSPRADQNLADKWDVIKRDIARIKELRGIQHIDSYDERIEVNSIAIALAQKPEISAYLSDVLVAHSMDVSEYISRFLP